MLRPAWFVTLGPLFIAIPMAAFGIQQLVYGDFVTRLIPRLPAWVPWHSCWAYLTGVSLIVAASAIISGKGAKITAAWLGTAILLSTLLLHIPNAAMDPYKG